MLSPATAAAQVTAISMVSDASPRSAATPPATSASSPWMTKPASAVVSRNTSAGNGEVDPAAERVGGIGERARQVRDGDRTRRDGDCERRRPPRRARRG